MMSSEELHKHREISLFMLPKDQVARALAFLGSLENIGVSAGGEDNTLVVDYDLRYYTLEILENLLTDRGFHLDGSLLQRIKRAIIHYTEEIQLENLSLTPRRTLVEREIFAQAWGHHPHGDHDDTPEELREYR